MTLDTHFHKSLSAVISPGGVAVILPQPEEKGLLSLQEPVASSAGGQGRPGILSHRRPGIPSMTRPTSRKLTVIDDMQFPLG